MIMTEEFIYTVTIKTAIQQSEESPQVSQPPCILFFNSDANSGKGTWMTNSFIDSNDMSGDAFLSNLVHDTPTISEYINNATNGGVYDFKETNGQSGCVGEDHYRVMPIGETGDG